MLRAQKSKGHSRSGTVFAHKELFYVLYRCGLGRSKACALALDETGRQMGSIRVTHTPEGLAKLNAWLLQILGDQPKKEVACIIETTHGLLIAFLLEHGWPVYPVNPRTFDRRRSASGAKTDVIDAYLLAKTGRADFADLHQLVPDSEKVAERKRAHS